VYALLGARGSVMGGKYVYAYGSACSEYHLVRECTHSVKVRTLMRAPQEGFFTKDTSRSAPRLPWRTSARKGAVQVTYCGGHAFGSIASALA